ncbi:MAG: sigma 54-interacting transcriptional regulator [Ferruginibacter sp.]
MKSTEPDKDLLLFHFSLENLHEAVFMIDSRSNIFQVNAMACQMTGYTKQELTKMTMADINPAQPVPDFESFWKKLKRARKLSFDSQHRHKNGHLYDVEITENYIEYNGEEYSCSIVRDISLKKREEELLRTVSEATSNVTGKDFLVELSRNVCRVMGMKYCFVAECADKEKTRFRTIVFTDGEKVMDNFEYAAKDSACQMMLKGEPYFLSEGAHKLYKGAVGIESYIGAPIISNVNGEVIGHIAASDTKPISNEKNLTAILKIFAARIGAEMVRMKAEEERKKESELLRTVSEATSGLVGQDFFEALTQYVTISLGVKTCIITECTDVDRTRVRTLAYTKDSTLKENIEYDIEHTPCKLVMSGKGSDVFIPSGVDAAYPKEAGYDSYVAVPIYNSSNTEVIGHIAALDDKPMSDDKNQTSILKIFAARAGAEIDRIKAEEKLKLANIELESLLSESEQRYRDLFEEAPIAYVHEGLDSKFIKANRAALNILGVRPDEVPNMYGRNLVPDTPEAQKRLKDAFDSVGRGTDTSGVVLELRRKDNGQPIWIQWWSNPDAGGQFTRTMFVDITDKVMMEQEQARLQAQNQYLQEEIKHNHNFDEIVSKSRNFHKVLQQVEQVASTNSTVLIMGESGTGKELLARAVHNISNRSKRPLVKVNCATLPANLIESELFGHEKGAFTGAMERKIGRFELADGGTIFLDEIGELPIELQAKLLRVLQEGEFERLGNPRTMKVNVRVIAATNRNLEQAIDKKEFREDLYYRLNVFPITCPPLRERKEDIPLLVKHFLQKHEPRIGKKVNAVSAKVMDALTGYDWPGNIRELENLIERAMILCPGETLEPGPWLPAVRTASGTNGKSKPQKLTDLEKDHILEVLEKTNWKVSGEKGAAKILGLNPTTLEARMKKLGIKRKS